MPNQISNNVWAVLACSYCGHSLHKNSSGASCSNCGSGYKYNEQGTLDLRLVKPRSYPLEFKLGTPLLPANGFQFNSMQPNDTPDVDFANVGTPWHLTAELMSYFPKAKGSRDSLMLDLGCGDANHRTACEHAGFEWVGLDYDSPRALLVGDAHALPFKDDVFEFILSIAVLEHIRFPFVMMSEAYRVLKPGGRFVGTVAFLEPFHGDSFYHHSHLGAFNSLQFAGFRIDALAPSERWSGLTAQASMGLFPKMPQVLSRAIVWPVELLHKLWWKAGSLVSREADKNVRVRNLTGAFMFVATKNPV